MHYEMQPQKFTVLCDYYDSKGGKFDGTWLFFEPITSTDSDLTIDIMPPLDL